MPLAHRFCIIFIRFSSYFLYFLVHLLYTSKLAEYDLGSCLYSKWGAAYPPLLLHSPLSQYYYCTMSIIAPLAILPHNYYHRRCSQKTVDIWWLSHPSVPLKSLSIISVNLQWTQMNLEELRQKDKKTKRQKNKKTTRQKGRKTKGQKEGRDADT